MTHGTGAGFSGSEQRFDVEHLTRVEGEGSLVLHVEDGKVLEARLGIFEAPRYFERLVVGRTPNEVIDIVARICGICPVAYQMSAVHAFEALAGISIDPQVRALRRLFYCGEWVESHALHIYLLHLPDFLGYESAIELARDRRAVVQQGLRLKQIGNSIVALLGGRAIHPLSVRVGGFTRAPSHQQFVELRGQLQEAIQLAEATVELVCGLDAPTFEREPRLVALRAPAEYPMNNGRIVSNDGLDIAASDWETAFAEDQVAWSNALQARTTAGEVYLLGPAARLTLNADRLNERAGAALARSGLADAIRRNPFWSIAARAIELVQATSEALEIVDRYQQPAPMPAHVDVPAGTTAWATEAPRGLLFHRYDVDAEGLIVHARIVPPTSQNQAAIEADLTGFAPRVLELAHHDATVRLEQLIRSYDPCISCATHFLDLSVIGSRQ